MKKNFLLLTDFYPDTLENIIKNDLVDYNIYSNCPVLKTNNLMKKVDSFSAGLIFQHAYTSLPTFKKALKNEEFNYKNIVKEVFDFSNFVQEISKKVSNLFVFTFGLPNTHKKFSVLDYNNDIGLKYLILKTNDALIKEFSKINGIHLIDINLLKSDEEFSQLRSWYISKQLYSIEQLSQVSYFIKSGLETLNGKNKKLIICDLDNTIWGGVVGDDGIENLRIGGHDPIGEAYVDFQNYLLSLKNKGILLAISSKNSFKVAIDVLKNHPEMILRDDDFVSMKINWDEKYQNIKMISNQLGIGLSDIVFLDDNPIEREKVKKFLPQVMTIDLPSTPLNYVEYLSSLDCFDLFTFSNEDRNRTELYKMKKEKEDNQLNLKKSEKVFFESKIVIEKFNKNNLLRISQLINKTNQFNLKTRRMTVIELSEWVSLKENFLWSYRVLDKFGDHGLTGIGSFTINGQDIIVEDFVLSCRVLGYGIENAILCHLIKESRKLNKQNLIIELLKTEKNDPIEKFLNQSDLFKIKNNSYLWDLNKDISYPKTIQII